jgi:hypothetical protein
VLIDGDEPGALPDPSSPAPDGNRGPVAGDQNGDGSAGGVAPDERRGPAFVTGGPGWGALVSALQALGLERPPIVTVLPMLIGTTAAMTAAFAFAIFGKKRRDEQPPAPDEVLEANAARGFSTVPGGEVANGVVRTSAVPMPIDAEAGMPRWRRPSLLEARKADPTRAAAAAATRLRFDGEPAEPGGLERRVIRYRVVRLLDAPDELRSSDIGQLDQGDEVQLLERSGTYWLVRCPDGRQGWIHKMTLGDVLTDGSPAVALREIDEDVLTAFIAARARA